MITVTNKLATTTPISETVLESIVQGALDVPIEELEAGVQKLLGELAALPEAQAYKFIATVTHVDSTAQGPLQTFTGARWDAQHDGTWVFKLESRAGVVAPDGSGVRTAGPAQRLVVLSWIKA